MPSLYELFKSLRHSYCFTISLAAAHTGKLHISTTDIWTDCEQNIPPIKNGLVYPLSKMVQVFLPHGDIIFMSEKKRRKQTEWNSAESFQQRDVCHILHPPVLEARSRHFVLLKDVLCRRLQALPLPWLHKVMGPSGACPGAALCPNTNVCTQGQTSCQLHVVTTTCLQVNNPESSIWPGIHILSPNGKQCTACLHVFSSTNPLTCVCSDKKCQDLSLKEPALPLSSTWWRRRRNSR